MTLRKTERLLYLLALCTLVCVVLAYLVSKLTALVIALIVLVIILCVAVVVVNLMFWRCPHCEKHLGRDYGAYCQHCGKPLDMDQPIPSRK